MKTSKLLLSKLLTSKRLHHQEHEKIVLNMGFLIKFWGLQYVVFPLPFNEKEAGKFLLQNSMHKNY